MWTAIARCVWSSAPTCGAVVSNSYNQTGALHTILCILGLPAMNQMEALAPLMRECFATRPDLRPYTHLRNRVALDAWRAAIGLMYDAERA